MVERLSLLGAAGTDPYQNLGLEEYLLTAVQPGECVLYLWQNHRTVVIGRNQNAWKECRTQVLEGDGGHLARRLSGGGAVFHDLGNLNFTFLAGAEDFDVPRQTEVIREAVGLLGLRAERTGRNDITVDGRKFSGNAYYRSGDRCCHHGTILLEVDKAAMERYLSVSREKLRSKSVDSVKSRVANLCEFLPGLTPARMGEALAEAFSTVYALPVQNLPPCRLDKGEMEALAQKFASWDWKYGRNIPFSDEAAARFAWGEVQVQLQVEGGRVAEARVYSDALDTGLLPRLEEALAGVPFGLEALRKAAESLPAASPLQQGMREDLIELMERFF